MMLCNLIVALALTFIFASPVQAEIFKWTDENGKIHYTDDIGMVPDEELEKSEVLREDSNKSQSGKKGKQPGSGQNRGYDNQKQKECLAACAKTPHFNKLCKQRCGVE